MTSERFVILLHTLKCTGKYGCVKAFLRQLVEYFSLLLWKTCLRMAVTMLDTSKMKQLCWCACILLALASVTRADDLPDRPGPIPHTANREFWIETGILAAAWTADTASTAYSLHLCRACVEGGGLFDGSRSTAPAMAAWAGIDAGLVVAAYEWKGHVHNRYLHPLWRVPFFLRIEAHAQAAAHDISFGQAHARN